MPVFSGKIIVSIDIQNYSSFITAVLVFQAVPGAGTVAILDATARNGRAAGMAAVLGTLAGDGVLMAAAVLGLAAIMRTQAALFEGLQWLGVAYLCWLGVQLMRSGAGAQASGAPHDQARMLYFRQSQGCAVFCGVFSGVSQPGGLCGHTGGGDAACDGVELAVPVGAGAGGQLGR